MKSVIDNGSQALNIEFDRDVKRRLIEDAFGTVGTLQSLAIDVLDEAQVAYKQEEKRIVGDRELYESVAMQHADQLNAIYQTFAERVARGIRQKKNSTGIYAHMLWAVMEASEEDLTEGLSTDEIFKVASSRENRIQKPNLRQILRKIGALQVDSDGRGLILSYDDAKDEVTVVDKQLFLYRKYATVQWPWEKILEDVNADDAFSGEG